MIRNDESASNSGPESSGGLIEVRGLTRIYRRGSTQIKVLSGLKLDVDAGEFVAFMGPSGSGKTTLLNLLGGLDQPDTGSIRIAGEEMAGLKGRRLSRWRARHVGFVFQTFNLIPVLTAAKNVELPLLLTRLSRAQRKQHVQAALDLVGLAGRMDHYPRQLSGGQEQRVAIARALVSDPDLLLCDEPTGDLDSDTSEEIVGLLRQLSDEHKKTILMVTHDPRAAARADKTLLLERGRLVPAEAGRNGS